MKQLLIIIVCMHIQACLHAQGITLLYKVNLGWNDPLSWLQINTPSGQAPIQRVPTGDDDVVISSSMSGIPVVGFATDDINPDFNIGGDGLTGPPRCRSMHISNTEVYFDNSSIADGAPTINVYTSNGGFVIIDSGSNIHHGRFHLRGGNPAITDLQILHSTYGVLFSHADWSDLEWDSTARVRLIGSTLAGFHMEAVSGGNFYADSCTFETNNFILGDNSTDTLLNSTVTNNGTNVYLKFLIGRNANFVSANVKVLSYSILQICTSASRLNGDIAILGFYGSGGFDFLQEDPSNPLPNIINGNVTAPGTEAVTVDGDLKISGNISGFVFAIYNTPIPVMVNGQLVFTAAGFGGGGHNKLEFYGSTNSNISWNGGFPVDTLIINKTNCAKVTCDSSLYVSGATRILGGQLVLDPNDNYPYKFVCGGNVDIALGAGLLLGRNAAGVANIAVAGTLVDHNATADSTCEGLSNPYDGMITLYSTSLPVTLLDFYGRYSDKTVILSWSTEREINTRHFTVEKSKDQASFIPLTNIAALGTAQPHNYGYTDRSSLNGIIYYRLKMVDADGRFMYSKIIAIAVPAPNAIIVFPNPVKDKLFIRLPAVTSPTEISIADARGTVIKRLQLQAGTVEATVSTADLPAAVYSILFQSDGLKSAQQFVKQ